MKIAVVVVNPDPFVRVWSGTPAHLVLALSERSDVEVVATPAPAPAAYRILNALSGVTGRLGHRVNWEVEPTALKMFTERCRRQWRQSQPDVVIAMGWMPSGLTSADPPVVFWGDTSIAQRIDRAPHWANLSRRTARRAEAVEERALAQVDAVIMPSAWAIREFERRYALDMTKFHRIPFGSNITDPGRMSRQLRLPRVRVLSIGVEWYRKGLDVAVEAVGELRSSRLNATLDVVGATPPESTWQRDYVAYHGFLDKSRDADLAKLVDLYHQADVFLLPTRSDPSPMVLGEAGAYSLPIVAAKVDGVPERVADGGVLLPFGSSPLDYATAIERLLSSDYSAYSQGSRLDYESRSDWRASADQLVATCEVVVRQRATANEPGPRRST